MNTAGDDAQTGDRRTTTIEQPEQPCAVCGRETAVGGLLHDARRSLSGFAGGNIFVCADCVQEARVNRGGQPPSDDDLRNFIRGASLAAIAWGNG
jgi:hypothetical protein